MHQGELQEQTCLIGTGGVTLLVTDACHFRPDIGPQGHERVQQRPGQRFPDLRLIVADESDGRLRMAETLKIHDEEGNVSQDVTEAEAVVELEAVKDPRPVLEAVDVVGLEVPVSIADLAGGNATHEQRISTFQIASDTGHHGIVGPPIHDPTYKLGHRDHVRLELPSHLWR